MAPGIFSLKIATLVLGFMFGVFVGMFICNSRADERKTTDRVLFGAYLTASAIDGAQTIQALDQRHPNGQPMFSEDNPL